MEYERIRQLTLLHLDGLISDEQFAELQELLQSSSALRSEYVKLARLDVALRDAEVGGFALPVSRTLFFSRGYLLVAVAAVVLLTIPGWIFLNSYRQRVHSPTLVENSSSTVRGIAVITAEAGAVWEGEGSQLLHQGVSLTPGRLVLREGLAQIDFYSGASVTLLGPAELELINRDSAVLLRGKLKADVPPAARGFKIRTAGMVIEDLGTSFGLATGTDDQADLVVFDGEVRATGSDGKPISVFGGDALRLSTGEAKSQATADVGSFPNIEDVIAGADDREKSRYAKWRQASLKRSNDPRLVAYYNFEELTNLSRRLKNGVKNGAGSELDGGIVGARVTKGRWPQKTALDFRSEGDRVRFQIPGEFDALTIFVWVRIDALDRYLNSLFLTDNYDSNEFHWQLSGKGSLHFATSPKGIENLNENNRRFYSDVFWNPGKSGQWFFLATTVDRKTGTVTHYVNGDKVGLSGGANMEKPLPMMRIGAADLGNWTDPIELGSIRTLNGRIDEFAIYSVVLSAVEIEEIYETGKP